MIVPKTSNDYKPIIVSTRDKAHGFQNVKSKYTVDGSSQIKGQSNSKAISGYSYLWLVIFYCEHIPK